MTSILPSINGIHHKMAKQTHHTFGNSRLTGSSLPLRRHCGVTSSVQHRRLDSGFTSRARAVRRRARQPDAPRATKCRSIEKNETRGCDHPGITPARRGNPLDAELFYRDHSRGSPCVRLSANAPKRLREEARRTGCPLHATQRLRTPYRQRACRSKSPNFALELERNPPRVMAR